MTTAPTPSEKVQRLAITLEIVGAVPDMNYVTVPRHVARDASVELRRLQAENERLQQLLQCDTPRYCSSVQRCTAGDEHRAELEARKPLPVSVERLDELWASQRSFHGGEPLKMGHVEFARLIEVEYGVLGRIPMREENGGQIDHSLIASREVVADGPVRVTRLNLTDEARAGLTSKATGPLPGITGGSS